MAAGMAGLRAAYHVAGVNTMCPDGPGRAVPRQRARRRARGAGRGARAACRASCSRRRRPRWARRRARSGPRTRRTAAATCRSTSAPSTRASSPRSPPRASAGIELVAVNPSSVQGPGRAGGTGRILIAYLNGRLRAFVDTSLSLVDIDDCVEAHVLAAERGAPGERYVISGATISAREALEIVAGDRRRAPRRRASCPPRRARRRRRRRGRVPRPRAQAAGVPRDGPHAAPRPPLRRLARGARARARLHARRGDVPAHDRVGARRRASCTPDVGAGTGAVDPEGMERRQNEHRALAARPTPSSSRRGLRDRATTSSRDTPEEELEPNFARGISEEPPGGEHHGRFSEGAGGARPSTPEKEVERPLQRGHRARARRATSSRRGRGAAAPARR